MNKYKKATTVGFSLLTLSAAVFAQNHDSWGDWDEIEAPQALVEVVDEQLLEQIDEQDFTLVVLNPLINVAEQDEVLAQFEDQPVVIVYDDTVDGPQIFENVNEADLDAYTHFEEPVIEWPVTIVVPANVSEQELDSVIEDLDQDTEFNIVFDDSVQSINIVSVAPEELEAVINEIRLDDDSMNQYEDDIWEIDASDSYFDEDFEVAPTYELPVDYVEVLPSMPMWDDLDIQPSEAPEPLIPTFEPSSVPMPVEFETDIPVELLELLDEAIDDDAVFADDFAITDEFVADLTEAVNEQAQLLEQDIEVTDELIEELVELIEQNLEPEILEPSYEPQADWTLVEPSFVVEPSMVYEPEIIDDSWMLVEPSDLVMPTQLVEPESIKDEWIFVEPSFVVEPSMPMFEDVEQIEIEPSLLPEISDVVEPSIVIEPSDIALPDFEQEVYEQEFNEKDDWMFTEPSFVVEPSMLEIDELVEPSMEPEVSEVLPTAAVNEEEWAMPTLLPTSF